MKNALNYYYYITILQISIEFGKSGILAPKTSFRAQILVEGIFGARFTDC
jgi:hypothetical protein